MPEWLIERGIGETRAVLADGDEIRAAIVEWPGRPCCGQSVPARLIRKPTGGARGLAASDSGEQFLLDRLPKSFTEGQTLDLTVVREAMAEQGRHKLPLARPGADVAPFTLAKALARDGLAVTELIPGDTATLDRLGWSELWQEAWTGEIAFAGGTATFHPTPAMTLIDIDGILPARELALAAATAVGAAIRRFGLGGNLGIDFPTLPTRDERRAVDNALAAALTGWPHEVTAMNGFGFVQLVARLERPSLPARLLHDRAGGAARMLLRRAEALAGPGVTELTAPAAVRAVVEDEWLAELARRTARPARWRDEPRLAPEGSHAQVISP